MVVALALAAALPGAEEATRAALARIAAVDGMVHAVIAVAPDALDQGRRARGPLAGMPVLVKDNIETAGALPTTAGSLALVANVTHRDAPVVARLRAAGAVILGKTNLSEWANFRSSASISGWSAVGGQTRSPYALDRSPCGSSSGSAVAVAAGEAPAAIGTETDGSITCPAAVNGVVGLKPTVGLVSRARIVPISTSQDTPGPIAIDVRTAARLLGAIAGSDPADPATREADAHRGDYAAGLRTTALQGTRIGVLRFATGWSPAVDAVFARALDVLRAQGAILVDVARGPDRAAAGAAETIILDSEFKAGIATYLAGAPATVPVRTLADLIAFDRAHAARELGLFGQEVFDRAEAGGGLADPRYREALATAHRVARRDGIDAMLAHDRLDALVAPTTVPAWKIDVAYGDRMGGGGAGWIAAIAGTPHLTVPMGMVGGLPVGLSLMGAAWSEGRLLGFGYAFEQAATVHLSPRFVPSLESAPSVLPLLAPLS
jgi:amidase